MLLSCVSHSEVQWNVFSNASNYSVCKIIFKCSTLLLVSSHLKTTGILHTPTTTSLLLHYKSISSLLLSLYQNTIIPLLVVLIMHAESVTFVLSTAHDRIILCYKRVSACAIVQLVEYRPLQWPGFCLSAVHVEFMMDKVALRQILFLLSLLHQ